MKRVIILVDGQNLYYGLKNINLLERDIRWDDFFKSLLVNPEDEFIRAYWFRPQRILDTHYTAQNVRNTIVWKHFNEHLKDYKTDKAKVPADVIAEIEKLAKQAEDWLRDEKRRFSQIEYNYDQLSLDYGDIEFVKAGVVKVNPYIREFIGEKGVDISLAVKMIALSVEEKCDKIILVSGDFDYGEAIKFVKNNMTKVHVVKLHAGYPPKNRSVSRDLAMLADKVIDVYESEIKCKFLKHGQQVQVASPSTVSGNNQ